MTAKCGRHSPGWIAAVRERVAVDALWKASGAGGRLTKGARSVFGTLYGTAKTLAISRIASENGQVISAVANLVEAVRKDVAQITAVRTWYNNLVYGKNDHPSEVQPHMTGLDQLSEHANAMLKGSQR
ncbi:hypothetical protein [Siccibacter turicensis]|uniref:hypothetical protein n=1 Tax=Siccibacter turicensis TaxID=357233 RepID=UPI0013ECF2F1|nr:hypothetical protein [Siccibacter turicensis]